MRAPHKTCPRTTSLLLKWRRPGPGVNALSWGASLTDKCVGVNCPYAGKFGNRVRPLPSVDAVRSSRKSRPSAVSFSKWSMAEWHLAETEGVFSIGSGRPIDQVMARGARNPAVDAQQRWSFRKKRKSATKRVAIRYAREDMRYLAVRKTAVKRTSVSVLATYPRYGRAAQKPLVRRWPVLSIIWAVKPTGPSPWAAPTPELRVIAVAA